MNHVKSGLRISDKGMVFDPSTGESYTLNKSGLAILNFGVNLLFTSFWYDHFIHPAQDMTETTEDTVVYGPLCMNIDMLRDQLQLPLLKKALHFIPGKKIKVHLAAGQNHPGTEAEWEVHTDVYNNSYIHDRRGNATAWFVNDGQLVYFTHYDGSGNNPLFSFFLACFRVPLAFDRQVSVTDQLPLSIVTKSWIRWLQDWMAPFYIFLQSDFSLNFLEADDALDPSAYMLTSRINRKVFHRSMDVSEFRIQTNRGGNINIQIAGKGSL